MASSQNRRPVPIFDENLLAELDSSSKIMQHIQKEKRGLKRIFNKSDSDDSSTDANNKSYGLRLISPVKNNQNDCGAAKTPKKSLLPNNRTQSLHMKVLSPVELIPSSQEEISDSPALKTSVNKPAARMPLIDRINAEKRNINVVSSTPMMKHRGQNIEKFFPETSAENLSPISQKTPSKTISCVPNLVAIEEDLRKQYNISEKSFRVAQNQKENPPTTVKSPHSTSQHSMKSVRMEIEQQITPRRLRGLAVMSKENKTDENPVDIIETPIGPTRTHKKLVPAKCDAALAAKLRVCDESTSEKDDQSQEQSPLSMQANVSKASKQNSSKVAIDQRPEHCEQPENNHQISSNIIQSRPSIRNKSVAASEHEIEETNSEDSDDHVKTPQSKSRSTKRSRTVEKSKVDETSSEEDDQSEEQSPSNMQANDSKASKQNSHAVEPEVEASSSEEDDVPVVSEKALPKQKKAATKKTKAVNVKVAATSSNHNKKDVKSVPAVVPEVEASSAEEEDFPVVSKKALPKQKKADTKKSKADNGKVGATSSKQNKKNVKSLPAVEPEIEASSSEKDDVPVVSEKALQKQKKMATKKSKADNGKVGATSSKQNKKNVKSLPAVEPEVEASSAEEEDVPVESTKNLPKQKKAATKKTKADNGKVGATSSKQNKKNVKSLPAVEPEVEASSAEEEDVPVESTKNLPKQKKAATKKTKADDGKVAATNLTQKENAEVEGSSSDQIVVTAAATNVQNALDKIINPISDNFVAPTNTVPIVSKKKTQEEKERRTTHQESDVNITSLSNSSISKKLPEELLLSVYSLQRTGGQPTTSDSNTTDSLKIIAPTKKRRQGTNNSKVQDYLQLSKRQKRNAVEDVSRRRNLFTDNGELGEAELPLSRSKAPDVSTPDNSAVFDNSEESNEAQTQSSALDKQKGTSKAVAKKQQKKLKAKKVQQELDKENASDEGFNSDVDRDNNGVRKGKRERRMARPWWLTTSLSEECGITYGLSNKHQINIESVVLQTQKVKKPSSYKPRKKRPMPEEFNCDQFETDSYVSLVKLLKPNPSTSRTATMEHDGFDVADAGNMDFVDCGNGMFFAKFVDKDSDGIMKMTPGAIKKKVISRNSLLKYFVLHGTIEATIDNETMSIPAFTYLKINPGAAYELKNTGDQDAILQFYRFKSS